MSRDLDWMFIQELDKLGLKLVGTVSKYVGGQFHEYHLVVDTKVDPPLGILVCLGMPPYTKERIKKAVRLAQVGLHAMRSSLKDIKWV